MHRGIPLIAHYLPWKCLCLPQAYACARILQHHDIPYVFYLGAAFLKENEKTFMAHAWVECQRRAVVGGQNSQERFTVLPTVYVWPGE